MVVYAPTIDEPELMYKFFDVADEDGGGPVCPILDDIHHVIDALWEANQS